MKTKIAKGFGLSTLMSQIIEDNFLLDLMFQNPSPVHYCCDIKIYLKRRKNAHTKP